MKLTKLALVLATLSCGQTAFAASAPISQNQPKVHHHGVEFKRMDNAPTAVTTQQLNQPFEHAKHDLHTVNLKNMQQALAVTCNV